MPDTQDKKYFPILPALKDGQTTRIPEFNGKYGRDGIGLLSNLANDFKISSAALDMDECGIPNAWARPLNFEAILYRGEAEDELRNRVRGEWRGMLALFAFREKMGFDVRCHRINLENINSTFLRAMRSLCPPDIRSLSPSNTTWKMAHVFTYVIAGKESPIGITSPTTIVSTAADYAGMIANVPWYNGVYLVDPTKFLREERSELIYWLNTLRSNLENHERLDETLSHYFFTELQLFVEQLGGDADRHEGQADCALSDNIYEKFNLEGGIFKHIKRPLRRRGDIDIIRDSDVMIVGKEDAKEQFLFVDSRLASAWDEDAKSIKVIGPYTLEGVDTMLVSDRDRRYGGLTLPENVVIKTADGVFTDRLGVILQGRALPGSQDVSIVSTKKDDLGNPKYMHDAITPIIPLRKDILEHILPSDIAERLSFKLHFEDNIEVITVYFTLKLSKKDFTVYKTFTPDKIEKIREVPVVEIWPDFRDKRAQWQPYYCFFAKTLGAKTFSLEPNVNTVGEVNFKDERDHRRASDGNISGMRYNTEGWIKMAEYPSLMRVSYEGKDYGAILLKPLRDVNQQEGKKWIISIDFGTTSTKIGRKEAARGTEFSFKVLPFSITHTGSLRSEILPEYFLPEPEAGTDSISSMFFTIYHDFSNIAVNRYDDPLVPLLNGHTMYHTKEGFDVVAPGIKSNLKWGNDTELIKRFLAQVTLQCTAEAVSHGVNSIEWRYSYPKALPYHIKESLNVIFQLINEKINETTGICGNTECSILSTTEGIATGLYFRNDVQKFSHAVCVDIGGGTADVTIWNGSALLLEASLRLAGRNLFLDILFKNLKVLKKLGCSSDEFLMLEDLVRNKTELEFYAQADILIKKASDKFSEMLPTCNINGDAEVTELCDLVATGLAGIFFYIGLMLRYLQEAGASEGKQSLPTTEVVTLLPSMFFGGNGAKLFRWAARGAYSQKHKINDLFKSVMVTAMKRNAAKDKHLNIAISKNLKGEVANGLLYLDMSDEKNPKAPQEYEDSVFSGGDFYGNDGTKYSEGSLIDTEKLTSGIDIGRNLSNIKLFVETYNKKAKYLGMRPIDINHAGILDNVYSCVKGTLNEYRGKNPADVPLEPIFILCLKALIQELACQWKERHGDESTAVL